MRGLTTPEGLDHFMDALGRTAHEPISIYFTWGVTALPVRRAGQVQGDTSCISVEIRPRGDVPPDRTGCSIH